MGDVHGWADWLGLAFGVAVVYVVVRPGSKAGETIDAFAKMMTSMVRTATDTAT